MTQVSEDRIEEIADAVESDPSAVGDDDLTALLEAVVHADYDIASPASEALKQLVDELSDEEITERFDADRLRGRLTTDQYMAGKALTAVLETLAETDPETVRELRPDIREGVGEDLRERTVKEALCSVLSVDPELVEEARTLMHTENSTARNIGVRLVNEIAGRGYDVDETDPDAVEPALPDVWDVLKNSRETSKPRENAASALATHAEERPEAYTDRMDEVAAVLRTVEPAIRYDLLDLPQAVAAHDPDAVAPLAPVISREFTDITGRESTQGAAIELLASLVDTHPEVIPSLDPFVAYVEDDSNQYDDDAATVVATIGGPEHVETLLGAGKFDAELLSTLVDGLDDEDRAAVRETVRRAVDDDDSRIRVRALSTAYSVFHDEFDDPAALYLDRLDDTDGDRYDTVREEAATGLRKVAAEDPDRLSGAVDRLFEAAEAAHDADDYSFRPLVNVLTKLAVADEDVYARVVDDIDSDDGYTRYVAMQILSDATTAYPADLRDPVPTLLDLHGDEEHGREYGIDGSIHNVLGGLTYTRPDAVEPATDRFVEWYRSDDHSGYAGNVADLAAEFPEVPAALAAELAERYTHQHSGEYSYDDTDAAIALAHAAMEVPEQVRSGLEGLLDAPDDDQPASLPLVLLGLGDHDAVPEAFADEDGWLSVHFSDSGERTQLRLIRLVEAVGYDPAAPRLEEVEAEVAESDLVAEAAADALERLS